AWAAGPAASRTTRRSISIAERYEPRGCGSRHRATGAPVALERVLPPNSPDVLRAISPLQPRRLGCMALPLRLGARFGVTRSLQRVTRAAACCSWVPVGACPAGCQRVGFGGGWFLFSAPLVLA